LKRTSKKTLKSRSETIINLYGNVKDTKGGYTVSTYENSLVISINY